MPPLPIIEAKELIAFLLSKGFLFQRQKGSHQRYRHPDGRTITIPVHGKESLKRGLLSGILKELDISVQELVNFLNQ